MLWDEPGILIRTCRPIRAGTVPNGFSYDGAPRTPGFQRVCQPSECVSVMLVLDDGRVALGDCMDVIFTGAAGRDRRGVEGEMR
jgi:methylaspartate ammonia-lyase